MFVRVLFCVVCVSLTNRSYFNEIANVLRTI